MFLWPQVQEMILGLSAVAAVAWLPVVVVVAAAVFVLMLLGVVFLQGRFPLKTLLQSQL